MKECKFCGLKSKRAKFHELFCKLNPQRRKGSNQFTKYPDYKVSDETKRKISDSNRGKLWSEEKKRDICKWSVVKNLLVITKSEIKNINDKEFWTTFLKR